MRRLMLGAVVMGAAGIASSAAWAVDDPAAACVAALATQAGVDASTIANIGIEQGKKSAIVHLTVGSAKWDCYINGEGKILMVAQ